jgi:hypothetical protein
MTISLQKRIHTHIHQILNRYDGAWLLWCDPDGAWLPLLQRVAADSRMGGFTLHSIDTYTSGALGGLSERRRLQDLLAAGESFVLYVPVAMEQLGWLWGHALLAEECYTRSLRDQLLDWGWRPTSPAIDERQIAELARHNLQQDPVEWGSGGLQPDPDLLVAVLAGHAGAAEDNRYVLELTVDQAGLPPLTEDDLTNWRQRALARLLVTEAHKMLPEQMAGGHELLIPAGQRAFALNVLARWIDSKQYSTALPDLVIEADKIAALPSRLVNVTVNEAAPLLSQSAERTIFDATCRQLAGRSGIDLLQTLADWKPRLESHARGFWGRGQTHAEALPWGELLRLSDAAAHLLSARPNHTWSTVEHAISWYTEDGWRLDQAGEEILRSLSHPRPDLLALITPLRNAYRAIWEQTTIDWSTLWKTLGCPLPEAPTGGDWLRTVLSTSNRPTAVLVVDAFRYALAATLTERINHQEGEIRATLTPAHAPLPSITPLGMGMALPIEAERFQAELVNGKWQLTAGKHGELTTAAQRRAWWHAHGDVAEGYLLDMAALHNTELPAPSKQANRLVVYDNIIDKQGHEDELEMTGSSHILDRYLRAVERLRNRGWTRILFVTDHGYLQWPSSEEKNAPYPHPSPAYASRRALAYPADTQLTGPHALAPGAKWRIAVPSGAASFRAYGGLGYFHGGASLQEWIIPCLHIAWPVQAQPVEITLQPLAKVMSQRPQVTLNVVRPNLLQEDTLSRTVELLIRESQTGAILFRSEKIVLRGEDAQVKIPLQPVDGTTAERGADLRIEVRDPYTEKVIDSTDSVLFVSLSGW